MPGLKARFAHSIRQDRATLEGMKKLLIALFLVLAPAFAQTLVEITTAMAISSTLDSNVKFPSGSFKAGKGSEAIIGRIPDASKFNLETYVAKGIAARLQAGFVQQILTSFAVAGYFADAPQERQVNGEVQTRYNLTDGNGKSGLLFVVRKGDELVYVVGKSK